MKKERILVLFLLLLLLTPIITLLIPVEAQEPESDLIGYSIEGDVVTIWNPDTSYYFNKTSGIQWTEDPDAYWTRNIFSIGYLNAIGDWNKIYSADDLGTFERSIDSDGSTYVNATLWKDFNYAGYDLRLGVRYHLKLNDTELSVIIYAKNLGAEDYPVELGFAWMVTDIDIPNPLGEDRIYINETYYRLDEVHDVTFTDIKKEKFNRTDLDDPEEGYWYTEYQSNYRIDDYTQFITLEWDSDIPYTVHLRFNGVQEDAKIRWMVNAGIFHPGQEKSTTLYWADAEGDHIGIWGLTGANTFPLGIATDGSNIWTVDGIGHRVYKYNMAGGYINSWTTSGQTSYATGITTNGNNIWVIDYTDNEVYKYNMTGSYVNSFDTSSQLSWPTGGTTDGSNIWVVDSTDDLVAKYNMAGGHVATWSVTQGPNVRGIATDGNYFWLAGNTFDRAFKYSMAGNWIDADWDFTGVNEDPQGITTDGNDIWVVDADDKAVYKYVYKYTPTITSASISDRDNSDNVYAMKKYYTFIVEVNDADGATDIASVYLRGKNGAGVLWEVRATDLTGGGSWAIQSGANIIDLDSG